ADEAHDAAGRRTAEHVAHHVRRAAALHQNVGLEAAVERLKSTDVPGCAERVNEVAPLCLVAVTEHVHVEAPLHTHHRGEQADRSGAGDQPGLGPPGARTLADTLGVIPRLGDDARRLEQHAGDAERRIDLDEKIGLDAEIFGAVTVAFLDAALGVAAVAAHVPLADAARGTRHRVRPAYDADNTIADL